jgi:hypothetical protein
MKITRHSIALAGVLLGSILVPSIAPAFAPAQNLSDLQKILDNRQDKKNEWRNIAIGSGAVGILGLLQKDNRLVFAGAAGALYSSWRYEQDRKSQSKLQRTRAEYFSRDHFNRNGYRYDRKVKWKNGKKYYYFARGRKLR